MGELNIQEALSQLGGSVTLYRTLIKGFVDKYSDVDQQILQCLNRNEIEDARRLAHSMKGLSGNLGANELLHKAKALEQQFVELMDGAKLDEIREVLDIELAHFSEELKVTVLSLDLVLMAKEDILTKAITSEDLKDDVDVSIKASIEENKNKMNLLIRALATYNYETIMHIVNQIDDELLQECCKDRWELVKGYIYEYEYDRAKQELLQGVINEG